MREGSGRTGFGERFIGFLTDRRGVVYILTLVLAVFSIFSVSKTVIRNSITSYYPLSTSAGMGEKLLASEFTELAKADVFLENVSVSQCRTVCDELAAVDGVFSAEFDEADYKLGRGLIRVTLEDGGAVKSVRQAVSGYDGNVVTDSDSRLAANLILALVSCALFVLALIFVSRSWGDMFVIFVTTASAVILNLGTHFILGPMSLLTLTASGVVQAALTMYYSAGVCRRYARDRRELSPEGAAISASLRAMPRTLTMAFVSAAAVGGLCFASNGLGLEFALASIKGIVISVILSAVMTPCLIVSRWKKLDGSKHNSLLPKVEKRGKFTVNTKTIFPVLFCLILVLIIVLNIISPVKPYAYFSRLTDFTPVFKTASQITEQRIERLFTGDTKDVYLLVPSGDYDKQQSLTAELAKYDRVIRVTGLTTMDAAGYHPGDLITSYQFAEITGLDYSTAYGVFDRYLAGTGGDAKVPFIDVFMVVYSELRDGALVVPKEREAAIEDVYRQLYPADAEYHGDTYDKIKLEMRMPLGTTNALNAIGKVREMAESRYDEPVYLTGDAGGIADSHGLFLRDRLVILAASAVLMLIVLTAVLKRPGQAAAVTFATVSSCFMTMALPYIYPCRTLFTGPMLAAGVQAAALGSYGAVTAASYNKYKEGATLRKGIGKALKENYTLVTVSGGLVILLGVGLTFFGFSAETMHFGMFMAFGGVISLIAALCVIPQCLILWDIIVSRATHTEIELTNDRYRDDDIVAAFEQLKTDIDDMRKGDEQ